jgi:YD repeat-containing protein
MQQYRDEYLPYLSTTRFDASPDEFDFSFLGYRGKFFMGHDGQWKVISDQEIKLEFDPTVGNGFIEESGLRSNVLDRINSVGLAERQHSSNRYFNKFTLITPDGVRFEFGGPNATEYSVPYLAQDRAYPVPNTWYLVKITATNGSTIVLNYEPGSITAALNNAIMMSQSEREDTMDMFGGGEAGCGLGYSVGFNGTSNYAYNEYDGSILFPVYLSSITYSKGKIVFSRVSTDQELRWPTDSQIDQDLYSPPGGTNLNQRSFPVYFYPMGPTPNGGYVSSYGKQRSWPKLTNISIFDDSYSGTIPFKIFDLNHTTNYDERLKLLTLQERGSDGATKAQPYIFTYNPLKMPSYAEIRSNDHWDFYNGFNPANFLKDATWVFSGMAAVNYGFNAAREPDKTGIFMKAEVLEQIQYPTGGRVNFEYEPHTYSKVVDKENSTFPVVDIAKNKVAGGLRIKTVSHYAGNSTNKPSLVKEYQYTKDFALGNDPDGMISSGILGGYPKYYWPNFQAKDAGGAVFTYSVFSSGAVRPFGFNAEGSHIGYSEVVEIEKDGDGRVNGYTKYKYSNFDVDIWGVTHLDEVGYTLDPSRSIYSPYTSNDVQRGKLLAKEIYSKENRLVRSLKNKYSVYSNGYVRRVLQEPFNVCASNAASAQTCFVTAFKSYINRYNLVREEVTEYADYNFFTTTTTYDYNQQNFLTKSIENTSSGSTLETNIKYPLDFTANPAIVSQDPEALGISKLVQKNIINQPIEIINKRDQQVFKAKVFGYKINGNNVFLNKTWDFETATPLTLGPTMSLTTAINYSNYSVAFGWQDFVTSNFGGGGGVYITIQNNLLTVTFSAGFSSTTLKQGSVKLLLTYPIALPDITLGLIAMGNYRASIKSGSLFIESITASPISVTGFGTTNYGANTTFTVNLSQTPKSDLSYFNPSSLVNNNGSFVFLKDEGYTAQPEILDEHDSKGNPRLVYKTGDVPKCYVWSYKKSLPVAEIIGATFSEVAAIQDLEALGNAFYDDATLRSVLSVFRTSLPNAQVTGYTFGPFGITSKIDPNGQVTTYEYDPLGRLLTVKDWFGRVTEAYKYHYSGQN